MGMTEGDSITGISTMRIGRGKIRKWGVRGNHGVHVSSSEALGEGGKESRKENKMKNRTRKKAAGKLL